MKILFLAANPSSTSRLTLDEEAREIEEGLRRSKLRDKFQFIQRWSVRPRDLRELDRKNHPMIRHYPKRYQQTTSPDLASFLVLDLISVEPELQTAPFLWA